MKRRFWTPSLFKRLYRYVLLLCTWHFLLILASGAYRLTFPSYSEGTVLLRSAIAALVFLVYLEHRR